MELYLKLSEDLKFFKNKTIGSENNAVIMGRKTYDSLNGKLPKRDNYIISSTKNNINKEGVFVYDNIANAIMMLLLIKNYMILCGSLEESIFIIGI